MADLYSVHLLGPDEIHAAPSFEEAEAACIAINAFAAGLGLPVKPHAVVAHWEGTAERHADLVLHEWPALFENAGKPPGYALVPRKLSRAIVGHVVDTVFDGCCENASVIEDIHDAVVAAVEREG